MRGVSKRIVKTLVVAAVVATLVAQPAVAASKTPDGVGFGSIIPKIILRALDTIDIGFPPG